MDWLRRGVFEFGKFSEAQRYTALKLKIMDRAKNIVRSRRGATDITSLPFIDQRYRGGEQTRPAMVKGIEKLTTKQREAVRLVYEEGLGVSEAARRLNLHHKSLQDLLKRAFRKLGLSQVPEAVVPTACPYCLECKSTHGHKPLVME